MWDPQSIINSATLHIEPVMLKRRGVTYIAIVPAARSLGDKGFQPKGEGRWQCQSLPSKDFPQKEEVKSGGEGRSRFNFQNCQVDVINRHFCSYQCQTLWNCPTFKSGSGLACGRFLVKASLLCPLCLSVGSNSFLWLHYRNIEGWFTWSPITVPYYL